MHNLLVGSYGIIKCYTIILVAFGSGYAVCLLQTSSCIVRVSESPDFDVWLTKPNLQYNVLVAVLNAWSYTLPNSFAYCMFIVLTTSKMVLVFQSTMQDQE